MVFETGTEDEYLFVLCWKCLWEQKNQVTNAQRANRQATIQRIKSSLMTESAARYISVLMTAIKNASLSVDMWQISA